MRPPSPATAPGLARRAVAELRTLPRQFWLLCAATLVLLTGVDMCFPFETKYMTEHLGASMTTIGLMLGIPLLASLPLHAVGGMVTDRYGRKLSMVVGVVVLTALYSTFALATHLWQIGIVVAIEAGFGWALFLTGSNAMVADLVPQRRRAEAYGITRVALHVGMVAGPLLAGPLIAVDPTYGTMFLTGAVICAAFVPIVLLLFTETRPRQLVEHPESAKETVAGYGTVLRDRRLLAFCAVGLLPLYGFGQIWSTFPVALTELHGMSEQTWSYLLAFYAATIAICQYPVVRLLRGRSHLILMAVSSACIGLGLAGGALLPWGWPTLVAMFVLGQGMILLIPIAATVAAELAPPRLRGRYMSAWTLVQMGGYALGPLIGGPVMDGLGARGAFAVIGVAGLLGAGLFLVLSTRIRIEQAVDPRADDVYVAPVEEGRGA